MDWTQVEPAKSEKLPLWNKVFLHFCPKLKTAKGEFVFYNVFPIIGTKMEKILAQFGLG